MWVLFLVITLYTVCDLEDVETCIRQNMFICYQAGAMPIEGWFEGLPISHSRCILTTCINMQYGIVRWYFTALIWGKPGEDHVFPAKINSPLVHGILEVHKFFSQPHTCCWTTFFKGYTYHLSKVAIDYPYLITKNCNVANPKNINLRFGDVFLPFMQQVLVKKGGWMTLVLPHFTTSGQRRLQWVYYLHFLP